MCCDIYPASIVPSSHTDSTPTLRASIRVSLRLHTHACVTFPNMHRDLRNMTTASRLCRSSVCSRTEVPQLDPRLSPRTVVCIRSDLRTVSAQSPASHCINFMLGRYVSASVSASVCLRFRFCLGVCVVSQIRSYPLSPSSHPATLLLASQLCMPSPSR